MFVKAAGGDAKAFVGTTLVLPAVSAGNVGQLALDLLINTGMANGSVARAGYLKSPHVLPIAGSGAYSPDKPGQLCVNLEVFQGKGATFLQQRAQVIPGREALYAQSICVWAATAGFGRILVLGGAATPSGMLPAT